MALSMTRERNKCAKLVSLSCPILHTSSSEGKKVTHSLWNSLAVGRSVPQVLNRSRVAPRQRDGTGRSFIAIEDRDGAFYHGKVEFNIEVHVPTHFLCLIDSLPDSCYPTAEAPLDYVLKGTVNRIACPGKRLIDSVAVMRSMIAALKVHTAVLSRNHQKLDIDCPITLNHLTCLLVFSTIAPAKSEALKEGICPTSP